MRSRDIAARAFALAVGSALSFSAVNADAFCRTTTLGTVPGCRPSANNCCTVGIPLYWESICVGYSLQKDGTKEIPFDTVTSIVGKSFTKWTKSAITSCPASGQPVSIDVRKLPDVSCTEVRYNKGARNQNVIVFRDGQPVSDGSVSTPWEHSDSNNTLGLTTVVFDPGTGEIFDADMEINTQGQTLSGSDVVPPNGYDFESIVTHEAGHFLGLAHSGDENATMYATYNPGTMTMRDLSPDDIGGICSVYLAPNSQSGGENGRRATADGGAVGAGTCDPTPRHGFSTECNAASDDGSGDGSSSNGCAASPLSGEESGSSKLGIFAALGLVVTFGAARRRNVARRLSRRK